MTKAVKGPIRSKQDLGLGFLKAEANKDLIKDTIPKVIGIMGIILGLTEAFLGQNDLALGILSFSIPHLIEQQLYIKKRKKEIDKLTGN